GGKVYVSNWGGRRPQPDDVTDGAFPVVLDPRTGIPNSGTVSVVDAASARAIRHIDVVVHPSAMAVSGDRLYVGNGNSDTVSAISTECDCVSATVRVGPFRGAPLGSSPNALAASADGKTLYVANGANNAIAVVRTDDAANPLQGLIPTGWYPTA